MATTFPNDPNGDVLRRLAADGDDLTRPRTVEFTVVFPDESSALKFVERMGSFGHATSVERTDTAEDLPWDVVIARWMVPDHKVITDFEADLENLALDLGGRNDGWGCFTEPDPSSQ